MSFDPVRDAGVSLFAQVKKAVAAAVGAGLAAAGSSLAAGADPVQAAVAGAVAVVGGFVVTYAAPANEPSLDRPPSRKGV